MSKPFDLLREFARFGEGIDTNLNGTAIRSAFGFHVDKAIDSALKNPALLQGQRAEAMFEALVISLGEYQLLKTEDGGRVSASEKMQPPDFRVVLKNGENWLIEVKNVYLKKAFGQCRFIMKKNYRESLERYAAATGGILKLAIFWARWSIWTLIDPEKLAPGGGALTLNMADAMKANELSLLGDEAIGIQSPLLLRLTMDPERTSPIASDGTVLVTVGKAQLFSAGFELSDSSDKQIAWAVMRYGDWETGEPRAIVDGDRLIGIEFDCAPQEKTDQGFELIGFLSSLFARYYADHTIQEGAVIRIMAPTQPEWLQDLRKEDGDNRMPIWRFIIKPNYEDWKVLIKE